MSALKNSMRKKLITFVCEPYQFSLQNQLSYFFAYFLIAMYNFLEFIVLSMSVSLYIYAM